MVETLYICNNLANEGECGTCKYFWLTDVFLGICNAVGQGVKETLYSDSCDCGKYEQGIFLEPF